MDMQRLSRLTTLDVQHFAEGYYEIILRDRSPRAVADLFAALDVMLLDDVRMIRFIIADAHDLGAPSLSAISRELWHWLQHNRDHKPLRTVILYHRSRFIMHIRGILRLGMRYSRSSWDVDFYHVDDREQALARLLADHPGGGSTSNWG